MSPQLIESQLRRVRRELAWWHAAVRGMTGWGLVGVGLWALALADVLLRFGPVARVAAWAGLAAGALAAAAFSVAAAVRKRSLAAVARAVEGTFPRLDNRLINLLQFAACPEPDAFRVAYVRAGIPGWAELDLRAMRPRRAGRRAAAFFCGSALLLAVPFAFLGSAWSMSLWRVLNPLAPCAPASLTRILAVAPGAAVVAQGEALLVTCRAAGRRGHEVLLDIDPAGGRRTGYPLGRLAGAAVAEEFSFQIPAVTGPLRYRFRVGDAPHPRWFTVQVRAPLAWTGVAVTAVAPGYTGRPVLRVDALAGPVEVAEGAEVEVAATASAPLREASLARADGTTLPLAQVSSAVWSASFRATLPGVFELHAAGAAGETARAPLSLALLADQPPRIQILAPQGRTMLAAGAIPTVQFGVTDDYGLTHIRIEQVGAAGADGQEATAAPGVVLEEWDPQGRLDFAAPWRCAEWPPRDGRLLAVRVVARDNNPFADREARSGTILFELADAGDLADQAAAAADVQARLVELIALQRENLERTRALRRALDEGESEAWDELAETQRAIRGSAGSLLGGAAAGLGNLGAILRDLYAGAMQEAIGVLDRGSRAEPEGKPLLADRALFLESLILRRLGYGQVAAEHAAGRQRLSGLLGMLDALVTGQAGVVQAADRLQAAGARPADALADREDGLASDVTEFTAACRGQAPALATADAALGGLVTQVADDCEAREVQADMLRAAESLGAGEVAQALVPARDALADLEALREMLGRWRAQETADRHDEVKRALAEAREKLERLTRLEARFIEALRQIESQPDASDPDAAVLAEEIAELKANMAVALLEIPDDLHIFPELTIANALVEDVYTVFEEVQAKPGAASPAEVGERGALKEESLLAAMREARERFDQMEMWLEEAPDSVSATTESFDREEMPEMALGPLPAALEDLIGDLLEAEADVGRAADDSATNHAVNDMPPGWAVAEGETASFGAQGRSGNQVPDHHEQTGRSLVGRQGQAAGETAAASGTINEGDANIENRLTPDPLQSGQVSVDGAAAENATGGGKQASGSAAELGMPGDGSQRRMDGAVPGSIAGLRALMARTQALHVQASLLNLRTQSLGAAAHHMAQAADAVAAGLPIAQVREHRRLAVAALRASLTELNAGTAAALGGRPGVEGVPDVMAAGSDLAPAAYRELVSEYFKSLGGAR